MDCSVIIPHRDRQSALGATLASLEKQVTSRRFEVIVIDDGSIEQPDAMLMTQFSEPHFVFVSQERRGISAARNTGWRRSSGRIIIFLDCDQVTKPDFVENSCLPFDEYPDDIIQFGERNFLTDSADVSGDAPWHQPSRPDERFRVFDLLSCNMSSIRMGWHLCYGHNVAVRRETLMRAGGFDEDFTGWGLEDCEFAFRLVSTGSKLVFNPAIAAYHQHHETLDKQSRFERWSSNLLVFENKHPCFAVRLQHIVKDYFDPRSSSKDWTRCVLAMEFAARTQAFGIPTSKESHVLFNPSLSKVIEAGERFPDYNIAVMMPRREFMKAVTIQINPSFRNVRLHVYDDRQGN
ncbi:glycosyltransferase [Agrobacterium sp. YIC 4121]|uniref:glycosyltransferase family 2 protein n=1 Tax=Agrobacterium sp. YIC 4121 TaxID=1923829 RepID=UPI00098EE0FA|nr:glycosyltransferase [Agrobacterium sp. YIC 4121]OOO28072.1 hypothetical protein BTE54_20315 [Agrobacterium sp. YIC 4121]